MIRSADYIVMRLKATHNVQWMKRIKSSELKINSVKIKILVCVRDPLIETDIQINSQKLKWVHEIVNLLGSKITSDGKSIKEVN